MTSTLPAGPARASLTATLLGALVALGGCLETASFRETRVSTHEHLADGPIEVRTKNGAVEIEVAERPDVQITAEIRATSQERLDAVVIRVERDLDGRLSVFPEWPGGKRRGNESCAFTIVTPGVYGAVVRTSNGGVKLTGLSGRADVETSNGAIGIVDQRGDVVARSSNGAVSVLNPEGEVVVRTSNGAIRIEDAPESVRATSSNGGVSVRLRDDASGPVEIDTSNGSVGLSVGPAFAGYLTLDTSNGSLDTDGLVGVELIDADDERLEVRIGQGETRSVVNTSNGRITFRVRRLQ